MKNTIVTLFSNAKNGKEKRAPLFYCLTTDSFRGKVEEVRNEQDESKQKKLKGELPCYTVSCECFHGHGAKNIIATTNFIAVDIDFKDNTDFPDFAHLKDLCTEIPWCFYCGYSCRGNGFFMVFKYPDPNKHGKYFRAIHNYFVNKGIWTDVQTSDINRLRYVSYDPDPYINEKAQIWEFEDVEITNLDFASMKEEEKRKTEEEKRKKKNKTKIQTTPRTNKKYVSDRDTYSKVARCCDEIKNMGIDMTSNYGDWLNLGFSLSTLGEDGREFYHAVSKNYPNYTLQETDNMFTSLLNHGTQKREITIGTFFHYCKQYGIEGKEKKKKHIPLTPSYTDFDIFNASLREHSKNNLIIHLLSLFSLEEVTEVTDKYKLGTVSASNSEWYGATVFWQIDGYKKVRGGKIVLFDSQTGKQDGDYTWVHSALQMKNYHLKQCLFGEHLLRKNPDSTVAVVESEKTAVIGSIVYPDLVFVAVGGCMNFKRDICSALNGRDVIIFPDNGKFDEWSVKAKSMAYIFKSYKVSQIMEHQAEEVGEDIADLILRNVNNPDIIPELSAPSETHINAVEEREEAEPTTEREQRGNNEKRTENGNIETSIIETWKTINPAFANLCERLDLVAVSQTENGQPPHLECVVLDKDTYHFDEKGFFHFNRTPEQEELMKSTAHGDYPF